MDHSTHVRLSESELTEANLSGATVYGPGDEKVGSIDHVHGSGTGAQVALDVGGFLGIGSKQIAVAAKDLDFMREEDGTVHAVSTWTKDELKALPEHKDV